MTAKRDNILPYLPIKEILREASGKKISKEALIEASKIIKEYLRKIVNKALLLCEHARRKTLKEIDIEMAFEGNITGFYNGNIPNLAIERLLKALGAKRISDDAIKLIKKIIESYLFNLGTKAAKVVNNSRKKIIKAGDLKIANM